MCAAAPLSQSPPKKENAPCATADTCRCANLVVRISHDANSTRNSITARGLCPPTSLHQYRKTYTHWLGRYGAFLKDPRFKNLTTEKKMAGLLTRLALSGVSASTQNQAFNALLCFYRDVLWKHYRTTVPCSHILRSQPSPSRYPRQHVRANLLSVMKGEDEVRPALTSQNPMRAAGLALDIPPDSEQGGQNQPCLSGPPHWLMRPPRRPPSTRESFHRAPTGLPAPAEPTLSRGQQPPRDSCRKP